MKSDQFKDNVFSNYVDEILEINEHYDNCEYVNRSIPLDECACHCYDKQVFNLGRQAEEELFHGVKHMPYEQAMGRQKREKIEPEVTIIGGMKISDEDKEKIKSGGYHEDNDEEHF